MKYHDPESSTKTEKTKSHYTKQAQQLIRRHEKEVGGSIDDFAQWLINLKPSITSATWRSYKSAVIWHLSQSGRHDLAATLLQENSDNCLKRSLSVKKTSAKKKKSVTEREESMVLAHFNDNRKHSFWAVRAAAFFKATLLVGLRPTEWQSAKLLLQPIDGLDGPYPILKVKNAKSTNGRSHGEYRHLHLNDMAPDDLKRIMVAILYADKENPKGWLTPTGKAENWDAFYGRLRQYFGKAINTIFPSSKRGISIYSCRHQFIADLKLAGYKKEEIAALVGHGVDETAAVHYGRKRNGRSGRSGLPNPNTNEVSKIRILATPSIAPSGPSQ